MQPGFFLYNVQTNDLRTLHRVVAVRIHRVFSPRPQGIHGLSLRMNPEAQRSGDRTAVCCVLTHLEDDPAHSRGTFSGQRNAPPTVPLQQLDPHPGTAHLEQETILRTGPYPSRKLLR